ncbi:Tat protein [Rhizobium sp. Leaf384]|uniref:TIGR03808 family TAT-translocated repetitive protein n=1 Tax=unclassified Rhizobium TaxID=2613769 RepID=UPI00071632BE|nr:MULTISPECIES: TIGR03808 family TAT-translocated repetitive protein [unclassified Rhizobium]KQS77115.1 Tat protein [Rhizobium sp. Leaf384]KQS78386.1 Tat protein [Rhizobium sp. Leaf383]
MTTRRTLIFALAGLPLALATRWTNAAALPDGFRGALDAGDFGIRPGTRSDQSKAFRALLSEAVDRRLPVLLPPGDYRLSDITLPDGLTLAGTPGATRLVAAGAGPILTAANLARLTLTGLTFDAEALSGDPGRGLVDLDGIARLTIENCAVSGRTRGHGLHLKRCGGRIDENDIAGPQGVGIFAVDSTGLSITGNTVADCGNGGILVHRSDTGPDGTLVSGNRIARIASLDGGTGQNGNGINIFRAGDVVVSGNHISDCALSAIRGNAASNMLISANQCLRSGETAIYAEFGFEGAVVTGNIVDTAANGIAIVNFDSGGRLATVGQNIVRNIHGTGPYVSDGAGFGYGISAEADTVVIGNVIEKVARWALMIGWGPYLRSVTVSGNIVRIAPLGCGVTVADGAGTALITNNLFENVENAILGYRWTEKASADLVDGATDAFAHLTIAGNRRV